MVFEYFKIVSVVVNTKCKYTLLISLPEFSSPPPRSYSKFCWDFFHPLHVI